MFGGEEFVETLEQLGVLDRATAKAKLSYKLWRGGERRSIVSALHPFELLRSLPRLFGADKTTARIGCVQWQMREMKSLADLLQQVDPFRVERQHELHLADRRIGQVGVDVSGRQ